MRVLINLQAHCEVSIKMLLVLLLTVLAAEIYVPTEATNIRYDPGPFLTIRVYLFKTIGAMMRLHMCVVHCPQTHLFSFLASFPAGPLPQHYLFCFDAIYVNICMCLHCSIYHLY